MAWGIAARWYPNIYKERAWLSLVDDFQRITRDPLVQFWWNVAYTLICWVYLVGLSCGITANWNPTTSYLMSLLDCDWSMMMKLGMYTYLMGFSSWDYCTLKSTLLNRDDRDARNKFLNVKTCATIITIRHWILWMNVIERENRSRA
jgi:hypothetical protein